MHGKLRADKTCLNCGHQVEIRFCAQCGQENIEPKQPFYYLFTHFIEDFTHYDSQFWKTIKDLLFRPGKLTKTFLSGKRQIYVPPVKLYIFISFITFLIPVFLPSSQDHKNEKLDQKKVEDVQQNAKKQIDDAVANMQKEKIVSDQTAALIKKSTDSIQQNIDVQNKKIEKDRDDGPKNIVELDAENNTKSRLYQLLRPFAKKYYDLREKGLTKDEIADRYKENLLHTAPKVLFLYLPIFAFLLWLFHDKKKWWFYDHGIFTLHYFSFLLLATLFLEILISISDSISDNLFLDSIVALLFGVIFIYCFIYFFLAHHRIYNSSRTISVLKGIAIFILNVILMSIFGVGFLLFAYSSL